MDQLKLKINQFESVTLQQLDSVKLMNRTDKKFCLHNSLLPSILEKIKSEYLILEIAGHKIFEYQNTYFDTADNSMFINHQNGKGNRFKIRIRNYVQTDDSFLEIKRKNNKKRTIKKRISRDNFDQTFSHSENEFISSVSPYTSIELLPRISSSFHRITLVNKEFSERVTIDLLPSFTNGNKTVILENIIIIEVKQNKANKPAYITQVLKENKVFNSGFSKYCVGRSLLEENIKKNNFKPLLLKIKKEFT